MVDLENLTKKLLNGEKITLSQNRYNDGTEKKPDILIDHVWAIIEEDTCNNKTICVYLSKEDDTQIFETYKIYRIPYIADLSILKSLLTEAKKQSYLILS